MRAQDGDLIDPAFHQHFLETLLSGGWSGIYVRTLTFSYEVACGYCGWTGYYFPEHHTDKRVFRLLRIGACLGTKRCHLWNV